MVTALGSLRFQFSCVLAFIFVLAFASLVAPVPAMAQSIQVTSAFPTAAPQATYGLNVSIKGNGFKRGAVAAFYVTKTTNPGGVKVNSTTYKSSTELIANIDVADGATLSKFDIQVMSGGRTGKGTELFSVVEKGKTCYTSPLPAGWTQITTLNDSANPEFSGEFGRAIAVDRIVLNGTDAVVVAVGSRISGTVEVFLLDPTTGYPWGDHVSLTLDPLSESLRLAQGDVNGDFLPDIVVGQEVLQSAYLFLAQAGGGTLSYGSAISLTPPSGEDKAGFGTSVAIGDVDGDSAGEVIVGAPNAKVGSVAAAGKVFVFESNGAFQRQVTRPGPKKSDYFGVSLAVGNVYGDSWPDLVVGARGVDVGTSSDAGKVFVFPGPLGSTPVELTRSVKGEGLGYRSAVGNVDDDAYGDVVTVGYLKPPAVVFTGEVWSGQPADFVLQPQAGLDLGFGTNITAGDINGDAQDDVFVATPNATDNFGTCGNTGAAYAYVSGTGELSTRLLLQPTEAAEGLYGWAVAAPSGTRLLLVGEPRKTLDSVNLAGQVYVYLAP